MATTPALIRPHLTRHLDAESNYLPLQIIVMSLWEWLVHSDGRAGLSVLILAYLYVCMRAVSCRSRGECLFFFFTISLSLYSPEAFRAIEDKVHAPRRFRFLDLSP